MRTYYISIALYLSYIILIYNSVNCYLYPLLEWIDGQIIIQFYHQTYIYTINLPPAFKNPFRYLPTLFTTTLSLFIVDWRCPDFIVSDFQIPHHSPSSPWNSSSQDSLILNIRFFLPKCSILNPSLLNIELPVLDMAQHSTLPRFLKLLFNL